MKITEKWLKEKEACSEGGEWFSHASVNDAVDILKLLISEDRLDWANWLIVRVMTRPQYLAYVIFAAEQVIDIYEKKYPDNDKPRKAIEAAKVILTNDTKETRTVAAAAAYAAYAAAYAYAYAAYAAAYAYAAAAYAAAAYAYAAAAYAAAYAAYDTAAYAAAAAYAYAAAYAAYDTAAYAAAARKKMKIKILNYGLSKLSEGEGGAK